MTQITDQFAMLAGRQEKAFIPFLVIGDPDPDIFLDIVRGVEPNADIIELGIPFSDPIADGPVIQVANQRALSAGVAFSSSFALIEKIRELTEKPIVILTYANILGVDEQRRETLERFANTGVNGIIAADVPIEESSDLLQEMHAVGMDLIFLAAPTTREERLAKIIEAARGFLYIISVKGVTGARDTLLEETANTISRIANARGTAGTIPLCVGFGISKPAHITEVLNLGADGVIVGSAIVQIIEDNLADPSLMVEKIVEFVRDMKNATKLGNIEEVTENSHR